MTTIPACTRCGAPRAPGAPLCVSCSFRPTRKLAVTITAESEDDAELVAIGLTQLLGLILNAGDVPAGAHIAVNQLDN